VLQPIKCVVVSVFEDTLAESSSYDGPSDYSTPIFSKIGWQNNLILHGNGVLLATPSLKYFYNLLDIIKNGREKSLEFILSFY